MAKVTWLGDKSNLDLKQNGIFEKDKAVEVGDLKMLMRYSQNPHFKVEGFDPKAAEKEIKHTEERAFRAPSEQSAQGPVPKPGEPVWPEDMEHPELPELPPPEGGEGEPEASKSVSQPKPPLSPPPMPRPPVLPPAPPRGVGGKK